VVPGNDDAIRSIKLYVSAISEACISGVKRSDPASEISDEFVEEVEISEATDNSGVS